MSTMEKGIASKGESESSSPAPAPKWTAFGAIDKSHIDLVLLACCFCTGMVDAASFANWGAYVGMQTGNTVILGLSTAGLPQTPFRWLTTLVSISSFLLGALATFHTAKFVVPKGASTSRVFSSGLFLVQGMIIVIAAALSMVPGLIPQVDGPQTLDDLVDPNVPNVLLDVRIVCLIPPMAFQSGMAIACSRLFGFGELPVNVLTSVFCDIMGDFKLLALHNVKRNRRVGAVVLILGGAITSAWLMRSPGGLASVLWMSAGIKIVASILMFLYMPAAKA